MDEQNPVPQAQPVPPSEPVTPPKHKLNKWVALAIFVLVMGAAAAGAYYLKQKAPPVTNPTPPPLNQNPPPPPVIPTIKPFEYTPTGPVVNATVNWRFPTKTYLDVVVENNFGTTTTFYDVGTFKDGPYKGGQLYIGLLPCYCMGGDSVVRIAGMPNDQRQKYNGKSYAIIKHNSDPLDNFNFYSDSTQPPLSPDRVIVDTNVNLSELTEPDTITDLKTNQKLQLAGISGFMNGYNIFNATNLKHVFTDSKLGAVYTTPSDPNQVDYIYKTNAFYVKAPDWNVWIYEYDIPFVGDDSIPQISWSDNKKNNAQYSYTDVGGCGSSNYVSVVNLNIQMDLALSGLTNSGQAVYELKDKNHPILKDVYDNKYNPYNEPKVSYNVFLTRHPVFFWEDPFGRILKFSHTDFQPMAECAKPAIYLYPEKTSQVSVNVDPKGGFTYTDPDYGTGWKVTAKPDGTIIADGKEYPYLFWEGRGGLYQTPDKGFVVAQADVHNFLVEKLAKLGLNQKESADFIEYWEPYMQGSPYYFVTFMGNRVMDQLAPLEVSPKPDTVIRVLMDFKPLEKSIQVQGFDIKTPVRNGFTVVEWGGVKH